MKTEDDQSVRRQMELKHKIAQSELGHSATNMAF